MFRRAAFFSIVLFLLLIQTAPTFAGTNLVTFQVNMGVQKELGRFNPATDKVVVRGDFNSWSGNADELFAGETANVYKLTKEFSDTDIGTQFSYKFAIIKENGEVLETIANRTFTLLVGGQVLDVVFFNDRETVTTTADITFQADVSELLRQGWFHPATEQILVSGSFNGWKIDAAYALTVDALDSTLYTGTFEIADTVHAEISWKFLASPPEHFLDDGWEYGSNHVFTFSGENTVLEKIKPNIFPPASPLAQNVTVRFSVNCNNVYDWYNKTKFPTIDQVYLNGDFVPLNTGNWAGWSVADTAKGAMIKMFDDGLTGGDLVADDNVWSVEVTFPADSPSVHLYKYSIYSASYSDTLNAGIKPMDNEADSTRYHVLIIDDSNPVFANVLDYFGSQWRKVQKNENPVTFQVDMSIQQQLGKFDPTVDKIVVRGDFNDWGGNSDNLLPDENTGLFTLTRNFPDSSIGANFEYRFVIVSPLTDLWENIPNRHFILPAGGEELNAVYFNNRETLELTA
ncbi:MAG: hypothetical protein GWP06_13415, partial [Actinobacteria bacterium]|nr:hypothetical protein [Actinomycetota bacterium]